MIDWFSVAGAMAVPLGAAIYTINFGRWAWKHENYRGAIGLYLLAALTVGLPLVILLRPSIE